MATTSYDAIVIGSGQAGPPLAVRLAQSGLRTALVEREHLGGTCVNDGCIPTKTLVASARAAHVARRAADWGVDVGGAVSVDMAAVKARKDRVVAHSIDNLTKWIAGTERLTLVWGAARFTSPHTIEVNGETLEAPKIFINVGGRPTLPPWPGIGDVAVLTNISMMAIDRVPEHLIVAGGSYIGLEFAQMYRRFGARVTVVEYGDRLIAREDPEVSREVQAILEREGVAFHLGVAGREGDEGQRRRRSRVVRRRPGRDRARRQPSARCGRTAAEHRRPRPRQGRDRHRRARLHHRRRRAAHERARRLGARRRQRPRRLHAHLVQRPPDRRRQPARRRPAAR